MPMPFIRVTKTPARAAAPTPPVFCDVTVGCCVARARSSVDSQFDCAAILHLCDTSQVRRMLRRIRTFMFDEPISLIATTVVTPPMAAPSGIFALVIRRVPKPKRCCPKPVHDFQRGATAALSRQGSCDSLRCRLFNESFCSAAPSQVPCP